MLREQVLVEWKKLKEKILKETSFVRENKEFLREVLENNLLLFSYPSSYDPDNISEKEHRESALGKVFSLKSRKNDIDSVRWKKNSDGVGYSVAGHETKCESLEQFQQWEKDNPLIIPVNYDQQAERQVNPLFNSDYFPEVRPHFKDRESYNYFKESKVRDVFRAFFKERARYQKNQELSQKLLKELEDV